MEARPDQDALLWLQFKEGSRDAFAALYQRHITPLIAYGLKLCPDSDLLKDQIQELFVELWNSRKNLSPIGSVRFYLFKALRYKLIRLEKNRNLRDHAARIAMDLNSMQDSVETSIIGDEVSASQVDSLRQAIKALTVRQQEAIQLRYYQGFSNEQIANLMDLNYQSVNNLLHRALSRLKEIFKSPVFHFLLLWLSY
ncbi:MAG TPA: sigma-70 family RNA polymerase sigma factor [Puia sp.]|jgi:RNA polymerase sigma factor (sigma-70 family)|nr:sigma-70 family RNA polymerase sigma factor [Puia sp.]